MNARRRGGAGEAEMEVDFDISTISDEDILADVQHRRLGLKVLEQYDFLADLPAIPDASSPQATNTNKKYFWGKGIFL